MPCRTYGQEGSTRMFPLWVAGTLFHPAATFGRARDELGLEYWWILCSVFTLEAVIEVYRPPLPGETAGLSAGTATLFVLVALLILYDLHALFFRGAAWALSWPISGPEAYRYVGLAWSVTLAEDIVAFLPALLGQYKVVLWISLPFLLWYLIALTAGVRRLSGFSAMRSLLLTLLATIPVRGALFWLNWAALAQ